MADSIVKINQEDLKRLAALLANVQGAIVENAVKRSAARWATEYKRQLRLAIDQTTNKDTGTLRKSPKIDRRRRGTEVRLRPTFPTTAYTTRNGKVGQYAFVVNHTRKFIELAGSRMGNNAKVADILGQNIVRAITALSLIHI